MRINDYETHTKRVVGHLCESPCMAPGSPVVFSHQCIIWGPHHHHYFMIRLSSLVTHQMCLNDDYTSILYVFTWEAIPFECIIIVNSSGVISLKINR